MWCGVGILLNIIAYHWVKEFSTFGIILSVSIGTILGIVIAKFGFSKIANKNIFRIFKLPEKVTLFAFQEPKSYILILFMMSLGVFMRKSGYVPEILLALIYIGIGSALFLAGLTYFVSFYKRS